MRWREAPPSGWRCGTHAERGTRRSALARDRVRPPDALVPQSERNRLQVQTRSIKPELLAISGDGSGGLLTNRNEKRKEFNG